jgi:hypothetical protein
METQPPAQFARILARHFNEAPPHWQPGHLDATGFDPMVQ